MSLFFTGIVVVVLSTALFDFLYYLPRFKAMQEAEEKLELPFIRMTE